MAVIQIQYFGIAQDYAKKTSETLNFEGNIGELLKAVYTKYPALQNKNIKVSVNNQIINLDDEKKLSEALVQNNYEILFLPPFAGG